MYDLIANSVFKANGKEYRPGDTVPADLPNRKELLEKGFVVYRGDRRAAREAAAKEAAEKEESDKQKEKSAKGRKAKVEE